MWCHIKKKNPTYAVYNDTSQQQSMLQKCGVSTVAQAAVLLVTPMAVGALTSAVPRVRRAMRCAGASLPARPPACVFGVAWSAIYLALGASWALSVASAAPPPPPRMLAVHATYAALTASLAAWPVVYALGGARASLGAMVPALMLAVAALAVGVSYGGALAGALVAPLLGWLVFACCLNVAEANETTARTQT